MTTFRHISAKKAWSNLTRDRDRYKFASIALLGLLYKSGQMTKTQVAEKLNEMGVTRKDLERFRNEKHQKHLR